MNEPIRVSIKKVTAFFLLLAGALTALHILGKIFIELGYHSVYGFVPLFDLDGEGNVPTYYSTIALLFCAILFAVICFLSRKTKKPYANHWLGLSLVFTYLSIDEFAKLHELITGLIHLDYQTSGIFYSAWIIPYGILLTIFLGIYLRFWLNLRPKTKLLFFVAGIVYVCGAVGFEILGEALSERDMEHTFRFLFYVTIEEFLEMTGIVILIYALLSYIRSELANEKLQLKFT